MCYLTRLLWIWKTFLNSALYYSNTWCLGMNQTLPGSSWLHFISCFHCHKLLLWAHKKRLKKAKLKGKKKNLKKKASQPPTNPFKKFPAKGFHINLLSYTQLPKWFVFTHWSPVLLIKDGRTSKELVNSLIKIMFSLIK